ncbi:hypothetical protein C8Q77DRAFT_1156337 [Trametes polyzona]|nr:hypothetical protein C8Q77DRAFT_1156337 [Trametes polyzona]
MHTYNTRSNKHRVYHELIAEKVYPNGEIIEVTPSGTGKGHHLRWHWSQAAIEESREGSTSRESSPSSDSDDSDATELVDDDGDSVMGDEEHPRTPEREIPFRPGSVLATPDKRRTLQREQRIGGGFDFWHTQDGALNRLAFAAPGGRIAPADVASQELHPDVRHVRNAIDAYRRSATPCINGQDDGDDDNSDTVSVCSQATVLIDPRATPEPTLVNGQMPLVRHPTLPADYDPNAAGPSGTRSDGLSTIQEEEEGSLQWPPRIPQSSVMRIRRNGGEWVREGSLGPDAAYSVDTSILAPRIDRPEAAAPQPAPAAPRRAVMAYVQVPVRSPKKQ